MSTKQNSKPIEIKISTVVAVSAILRTADLETLDATLKKTTGGAPDYFDNDLVVIDVSAIDFSGTAIDWSALTSLFSSYSLNPVAVRGAPPELEHQIVAHGMSIDTLAPQRQEASSEETGAAPAPVIAPPPASTPAPAPVQQSPEVHSPVAAAVPAMIIDSPVRAGQRIYARGCDLIVNAIVNNGAELIADGSIHVYAPLRGRALAGASGNAEARIFTLSMEAELVSIAGIYRTFDGGLPKDLAKQPAQVRLQGDRIDVLSIRA
ncbi:septum site-determining protein MinC [Noviherbaspirillum sp. Root189]|uniref:septum site-determining protein MinC n=1 Tax=Noviherbaspirillum sp. Root189 TaxID=1736487 RepID=UPI000709E9CE|nr:septum site-determining protein MinC [Noviherbaspirillum sp. Root189]KRB88910.1 cell division protein FtsZ [Noviherbaspirillum sp. Root189]